MERPIDDEELRQVMSIWSIEEDKSPGPDGFSMTFYKVCSAVSKGDVMHTTKDIFLKDFLDRGSNATFICLIPKKEGAEFIKAFWLISLVGSMYKIISKVLVGRMKRVLEAWNHYFLKPKCLH